MRDENGVVNCDRIFSYVRTFQYVIRMNDLNLMKVTFCGYVLVWVCVCLSVLIRKYTRSNIHFNFMVSFQIEMKILLFTGYEYPSLRFKRCWVCFTTFFYHSVEFCRNTLFHWELTLLFDARGGNNNSKKSFS